MHDPSSVAFDFHYPWGKKQLFITIWHEDPETDGSDDSCDWFNRKGKLTEKEKAVRDAMWDLETILDNKPHYPDSREHKAWAPLRDAIGDLLRKPSRTHWWQLPVRWHFWHWRIQVHPYMWARRWLLTRCCKCGGRFGYRESPISSSWDSRPPRWFRGEEGLYHGDCRNPGSGGAQQAGVASPS